MITLDELIAKLGVMRTAGRDTTEAAKLLVACEDDWLLAIVKHDPKMIRDVAAALIFERLA